MRIKHYSILFLALLATSASVNSCSNKTPASIEESKATSKEDITLSTRMASQLPLAAAEMQPIQFITLLSGKIDFNPNEVTNVYPLVGGVISHIYVTQGDHVQKGQVLADVYSSDFASAISDFQKAKAGLALTEKALQREQELLAAKVAAQRDVQQAESDYAQSQAEYDRSLGALKLLGGNANSNAMTFHITAPIEGTVVSRLAQPGSQVRSDGSTLAFVIGSTSSLWVTLDAYPDDLRNLHVGDSVRLKAAGLEDHPFSSRIEYISPTVDPTSFTTKIRCTLPNSGGLLKPAMFVGATVYHPDGPGLFVPAPAVFYDADGKTYVFIETAPHTFRKRECTIAQTEPDRVQITGGLNPGDTIVADHALFLNDELQADQK
ncbi:MAG TPA: efflux RND transporter periplasmic adaptor subunit [Candidatus Kapabacteria bacterium]|nr:efflux RND transporter periplasmic adaptor subunit [Candidatus Kapabacteria bacterium]